MPELPEVETIVRDLAGHIAGKKIQKLEVLNKGSVNLAPATLKKKLEGQKVKEVVRRAKNIILKLEKDYLVVHLKMTGQLVWRDGKRTLAGGHPIMNVGQELPNKFTRAVIGFTGGTLYFNDVRKFGWLRLLKQAELDAYLSRFGIEPLGGEFTLEYFTGALKGKKKNIKAALLDQSQIAGLGNIYVDEALWASGVAPARLAGSLTVPELKKLHKAIVAVLELSISRRGTSFNNYRDANGEKGANMKFLKVYGRAGEKCAKCKQPIKKIKLAGRGTHWCDHCQK